METGCFSQCSQSNLSSPPTSAVFFLLLVLWSFEQLPKLHGPIWHLRKMSLSLASCRLFCESFFVTDKSPIPFRSPQLACQLRALFCSLPPVASSATGAAAADLHAGIKQEASLCPPVVFQTVYNAQHTYTQQWSNTGYHV